MLLIETLISISLKTNEAEHLIYMLTCHLYIFGEISDQIFYQICFEIFCLWVAYYYLYNV